MLVLINVLFGMGDDGVDTNGHLGGCLIGVLLGFMILEHK